MPRTLFELLARHPLLDGSICLCHLSLRLVKIIISDRVVAGAIVIGGRWPDPVLWDVTEASVVSGLESSLL